MSKYASWKSAAHSSNIWLNEPDVLNAAMHTYANDDAYVFTLHEIYELPVADQMFMWQTRSSPNWQGGIATFATCKQNMRTYRQAEDWQNVWLIGLAPAFIDNAVFFVGRVSEILKSQKAYGDYLRGLGSQVYSAKQADTDPRGDNYRWTGEVSDDEWDVRNYAEPECAHTRKIETYSDGTPKWWKDVRFTGISGRRPPSFSLFPAFLFSQRMLYSNIAPGRASRRVKCADLKFARKEQG